MTPTDWHAPRQNVELKARLNDLDAARRLAAELSGGPPEILRQTDTYFRCGQGRMKLREIVGADSQLIAYARSNDVAARASRYHLMLVADAGALRSALAAALGILTVVEKVREFFLYRNVRIHLDQVARLGTFLEFEAVLSTDDDYSNGEQLVRELAEMFAIAPQQLVANSYSDLLLSGQ